MAEYMTLKQISDKLGIPKQQVYRFVKKNCINEALQTTSGKQYDEAAQELIFSHFRDTDRINEAHQNRINDTVYDAVLKQLEIKDKQIEELQKQLSDVHTLLDQEQKLRMVTEQKLLAIEDKQNKPWWQFFTRKNRR